MYLLPVRKLCVSGRRPSDVTSLRQRRRPSELAPQFLFRFWSERFASKALWNCVFRIFSEPFLNFRTVTICFVIEFPAILCVTHFSPLTHWIKQAGTEEEFHLHQSFEDQAFWVSELALSWKQCWICFGDMKFVSQRANMRIQQQKRSNFLLGVLILLQVQFSDGEENWFEDVRAKVHWNYRTENQGTNNFLSSKFMIILINPLT